MKPPRCEVTPALRTALRDVTSAALAQAGGLPLLAGGVARVSGTAQICHLSHLFLDFFLSGWTRGGSLCTLGCDSILLYFVARIVSALDVGWVCEGTREPTEKALSGYSRARVGTAWPDVRAPDSSCVSCWP